MIAFGSASGVPMHMRRALVCCMLAGSAALSYSQGNREPVLLNQKEGTLVVNYYSSAPNPELEQLRGLAVDALGVYLRGQMVVDEEDIGWQQPVRSIRKDMERLVGDLMRIRSFAGEEAFRGFSDEVTFLLEDFQELDRRDLDRMRGGGERSFEEKTYVLLEQRIQELLLQCGVELGHFVNRGLLQKIGSVEQELPMEELEQWLNPNDDPLKPIELNFNLETMSLLDSKDDSEWPEEQEEVGTGTSSSPELQALELMMARVLDLLESQDARLTALEQGGAKPNQGPVNRGVSDLLSEGLSVGRVDPASDPVLKGLNLPASFDVQFYHGSARLTLTAQLQLNEVLEYMGMYPQLRVVCTGHADVSGDRVANMELSKKRAKAVRTHLLESGVASTRVVLNYFGEERANNQGALDRRVEVAFFVDD